MQAKQEILKLLRAERDRWVELLAHLGEEQIMAPDLPGGWSVKDIIGHLTDWQQVTAAQLSAAAQKKEPQLPDWIIHHPDLEEILAPMNAWMNNTYQDQSWATVYRSWREGFRKILTLSEAISEEELLDAGRYPWMKGKPLSDILLSSYMHHHEEHLGPLLNWIKENRRPSTASIDPQPLV